MTAPMGKVPYVDMRPLQGTKDGIPSSLGDSTLILRRLIDMGQIKDLNTGLSDEQRAFDVALRALLEDKLYFYNVRIQFQNLNKGPHLNIAPMCAFADYITRCTSGGSMITILIVIWSCGGSRCLFVSSSATCCTEILSLLYMARAQVVLRPKRSQRSELKYGSK